MNAVHQVQRRDPVARWAVLLQIQDHLRGLRASDDQVNDNNKGEGMITANMTFYVFSSWSVIVQMIFHAGLKKRAAWMSPFPSQLTTHRKTDCYLWTIFKQKNKWLIVCVLRAVVDFLYHTKHVASYILKCVWLVNCATQPPCFAHFDLYFCQLCFIKKTKVGRRAMS